MRNKGYCLEPGICGYDEIYRLQGHLNEARQQSRIPDGVILLEHHSCLTVGRAGGMDHIRAGEALLRRNNVQVHSVNRGGGITYHGPGQLVCYPIIALEGNRRDVHAFARRMEELLIRTLAAFGIQGMRKPEYPGVWAGDQKVGAMGIAIRKWVTMHGVSLNVCPDLNFFSWIVPCGIGQFGVTSMEQLIGFRDMDAVRQELRRQFEALFGLDLETVSPDRLKEMTGYDETKTALAGPAGAGPAGPGGHEAAAG